MMDGGAEAFLDEAMKQANGSGAKTEAPKAKAKDARSWVT